MNLQIPDHLKETFVEFLDIATYALRDDECDPLQLETIKLVRGIVKEHQEYYADGQIPEGQTP